MRRSVEQLYPSFLKPWSKDTSVLSSLLTPHDLLQQFLGNKDFNVLEIDNELIFRYYRYSEFFSNTFISLTIFSVAAPLYLFIELKLKWEMSVLIGLTALIIALLCFEASHLAYIRYLKSQITYLCTINKIRPNDRYLSKEILKRRYKLTIYPNWNAKNLRETLSNLIYTFFKNIWEDRINILILNFFKDLFKKEKFAENYEKYSIFIDLMNPLITILFTIISFILFFCIIDIELQYEIIILFFLVVLGFTAAFRCQQKLFTTRISCKIIQEFTFSYVGAILAILIVMFYFPLDNIIMTPSQIEFNINCSATNTTSELVIGSLTVCNLGANLDKINPDIHPDWINISWNDHCFNKTNRHDLCNGDIATLILHGNPPKIIGEYRGKITICGTISESAKWGHRIVGERNFTKTYPIVIKITKN